MFFDYKDDPISWFFQNLFKPLFSHAEMLALAGDRLKPDTLQNWTNRKYLEPKIIKGKRRYNPFEVAQISIAHPLISEFYMDPKNAILAVLGATLIFQRKLKSKEFSLDQAPHLLCIFTNAISDPTAVVLKPTTKHFETDEAFLVLPFGRALNNLAQKQKQLLEARPIRKAS